MISQFGTKCRLSQENERIRETRIEPATTTADDIGTQTDGLAIAYSL